MVGHFILPVRKEIDIISACFDSRFDIDVANADPVSFLDPAEHEVPTSSLLMYTYQGLA